MRLGNGALKLSLLVALGIAIFASCDQREAPAATIAAATSAPTGLPTATVRPTATVAVATPTATQAPTATVAVATSTATQAPTLMPTATANTVFHPRYTQQVLVNGTPIIAGAAVAPEAVSRAGEILSAMLGDRPDIIGALRDQGHYVIVVEEDVCVMDLPEYLIWKNLIACDRLRGFGGTLNLPATSVGEENLLCRPGDSYHDQGVFVHEMGHTVMNVGLPFVADGPATLIEIRAAFTLAMAAGLWANTYSITNWEEYWAVGTAAWFDAQFTVESPQGDGVYNNIGTREALLAYDPSLALLLERVYSSEWRYACPD